MHMDTLMSALEELSGTRPDLNVSGMSLIPLEWPGRAFPA